MGDRLHTYLTTKDYVVLQTMLDRSSEGSGRYRRLLEQKVRTAMISLREDVPEDVVTLNTRLAYTVDGEALGPQLLVQSPDVDLPDFAISIHTLQGLALLGLRQGATICVPGDRGVSTRIRVTEILSQPEAEARRRELASLAPRSVAEPRPTVVPLRRRPAAPAAVRDDDDPGPFAA